MARRIGILLFAFAVLVGLVVASILIWATSDYGARFISEELTVQLKRSTGLSVSFGNLDIDLLPPRIRIREIAGSGAEGRVDCSVEEAELSPDLIDLFRGELTIEEVYLGAPRCRAALTKSDMDTIIRTIEAESPRDEPSGLNLSAIPEFDVFALSDGSFEVEIDDPGRLGRIEATAEGFGLDVTSSQRGIEVRGLVSRASGDWQEGESRVSESLANLGFRAFLTEEAVDFRHLALEVGGAEVRLRDAHVPVPLWPQGPDVADLSVELPLNLLGRLPLDLPRMKGKVGFLGQVSLRRGKDKDLGVTASGRANLAQVSVDDFVLGDLVGQFSLTPEGVAFAETKIKTADGTIIADGNVAFDEHLTAQIEARLEGIELAHLLEQVKLSGSKVTQKMTGDAKLKGRLLPLRLDGTTRLEVRNHTVLQNGFRSRTNTVLLYVPKALVDGKLTVTDRFFEGRDLRANFGDTRLAVDMRVNYGDGTWRLHARSLDFHMNDLRHIAGFRVGGRGPVSCRISGLLWDPRITGSATLDDFVFEGFAFQRATTTMSYDDLVLSFEGLTASKGKSRCSASELVLDFSSPSGLDINTKIEVEEMDVADLARIFRIDTEPFGSPSGLVFGRAAIDYRLNPEHFKVEVDLVHDGLTIFGERFGPDVIRATWNDDSLIVTEFGLTKGKGTISITGAMLPDRSLNFIGVASGIDSKSIDNPDFKEVELDTVGQAFVVVEGTVDRPEGWADIRLSEAEHRGVRYGPTVLDLKLHGHEITGAGRLAGDLASLEHLTVDLDSGHFDVEGFVHSLDLVRVLNVDTKGHRAYLRVTGDLALDGYLSDRPRLRGHSFLDRVEAKWDEFTLSAAKPLHIVAKNDRFRIDRTRFAGPNVVLDLTGAFGLEEMDFEMKALSELGWVADFFDVLDKSGGQLNIEARAKGTWADPSLSGRAELEDGLVRVAGFPHRIEQMKGRIVLSNKVIRFVDFDAQSAGGTLELDGEIRLDKGEIADYRFHLDGFDLELAPIEDLSLTASTSGNGLVLRPSVKTGLPTVTGDIEVRDLRYTHEIRVFELSDLTVDRLTGSQIRTRTPRVFDEKDDVFAFDIRLHGDRNLQAHNNLFDTDLVIDDVEKPLRLIGTNQTYGFLGRVIGKRGQVRFAGKRFEVKHASVEFQDPLRPDNPAFRVTADGQIRDWNVTMTAEGTVEEYDIRFSSMPFLPREDIIFVILTGMTKAEYKQFGSTGLSLGTPLLSQLGLTGEAIPLEFQVYSQYSEKAGTDTTRVALGRWVTQDVWVSVSSSIGQERDVEAQLDYKISDMFSISAGYENENESQVGNVGVDLKFRLEF